MRLSFISRMRCVVAVVAAILVASCGGEKAPADLIPADRNRPGGNQNHLVPQVLYPADGPAQQIHLSEIGLSVFVCDGGCADLDDNPSFTICHLFPSVLYDYTQIS